MKEKMNKYQMGYDILKQNGEGSYDITTVTVYDNYCRKGFN